MIIKQSVVLVIFILLSTYQNSMCMQSSNPAGKTKAPLTEREESGPPIKKFRNSQSKEETAQEQNLFNELPLELKFHVLQQGLESIINCNSIFRPLNGTKSYLNSLALVNKQFKAISEYLGWDNKLVSNNREPFYKMLVKDRFASEYLTRDSDELDLELGIVLSSDIFIYLNPETSNYEYDGANELIEKIDKIKPDYLDEKLPWALRIRELPHSERALIGAKYLIAGANPDILTVGYEDAGGYEVTVFEYFIDYKFERLIALLILRNKIKDKDICPDSGYSDITASFLKKQNIDFFSSQELLIEEKPISVLKLCITKGSPKIIEILFDYDCRVINSKLAAHPNLISLAIEYHRPKWVKFLLENGASIEDGESSFRVLFQKVEKDDTFDNLSISLPKYSYRVMCKTDLKTARIARIILSHMPSILTNKYIRSLVGKTSEKGYFNLSEAISEKLKADRINFIEAAIDDMDYYMQAYNERN